MTIFGAVLFVAGIFTGHIYLGLIGVAVAAYGAREAMR
jgi:hypothetical protein